MSALGGGADVLATWPESPLLAIKRHCAEFTVCMVSLQRGRSRCLWMGADHCIKCKLGTCSDRRAADTLRCINKHDWSPPRDYLMELRSAGERARGALVMGGGLQNLLVQGLGRRTLLRRGFATLLRDPFKVVGSIIPVTVLCLIAVSAPQADERESGAIIETDFAPALAPISSDDQTSQDSFSDLPAAEPSLQDVPAELIVDLPPSKPQREPDGSRGGDVASSGGSSASSNGSGGMGTCARASSGSHSHGHPVARYRRA